MFDISLFVRTANKAIEWFCTMLPGPRKRVEVVAGEGSKSTFPCPAGRFGYNPA
jgi:hypothetical protein